VLKDDIELFIKKNNLINKITYVGWISHDNLSDYLNELNLLVIPSYTEGLPNVMLEAMACGTPILATPVGAIPDIIEDGKTGFLMCNNSINCILQNLMRIFECQNIEEVSKQARSLVSKTFTFENAIKRYEKILNKL